MAAGNAFFISTPRKTARPHEIAEFHFHPEEKTWREAGTIDCRSRTIEELAQQAQAVARTVYDWDKVVDQYEALFVHMLRGGQKTDPPNPIANENDHSSRGRFNGTLSRSSRDQTEGPRLIRSCAIARLYVFF